MTLDDVLEYYGNGTNAAKAIGSQRATYSYWVKKGFISYSAQIKFEKVTKGKLIAERPQEIVHNSSEIILPHYRFYNKKLGMCHVKSLAFRDGKGPKIQYFHPKKPNIILSAFDTKYLCQATSFKDNNNKLLYINDIILDFNDKEFIIEDYADISYYFNEYPASKCILIGNIFEGIKSEKR